MSDFDVDDFLTNAFPNVGVGGATGTSSDLLTSPVGVGSAPPPMTVTPLRSVGAVGVGTTRSPLRAPPPTVSAGKQPRRHVAYKRMPRGRRRRPPGPSRRRSGGGGGDSSNDDDDDESDVSSSSSTSTNPGGRHRMSQQELRRQLELLSNDQVQTASGRRIAGITTTNTITTYKDGGRPQVARQSTRISH